MTPELLFEQSVSGFPELRERLLSLFKTPDKALSWLTKPKWQLGGRAPVDCLDSAFDDVLNLIITIERGDFS